MSITKEVIAEHGLSDTEYEVILKGLDREPTLTELGVFSVMWSEHCSYKSSRMHLKTLPTKGEKVIIGPGENAGVIDIGGDLACVFKMESHNHPSFIEPYQGAATGVGGILRDVFTMGARPVCILNSLRFGSPENDKTRHLLDGVVAGIAGYGNCMGIPTVGGEVFFHDSYNGNCLVNAMTVGIVKKDKIFTGFAKGVGNPVIYVGSKTGRDGIHGATMASDSFSEGSEEKRPTVQVGDPFTEKLLLEACLEAFKSDCIVGIQDMGAAGLTSSSVEMASRAQNGIDIDVLKVPRREENMTPYEILLSESQERMLIVAKDGRENELKEIFEKWDLDFAVIGKVTDTKRYRIFEGDDICVEIPVDLLVDDAPVYDRPSKRPDYMDEVNKLDLSTLEEPTDYKELTLKMLSSLNLSSKEWIFSQYDHMVRTDTETLPGSDSAVVRIKGTNKAIAVTSDCNSRYCYLDPVAGGKIAVAEAARNLVVSGATPIAITDCLNFGNPEKEETMYQFKGCIEGMSEACKVLNTPVIGGNVSFYNETNDVNIFPTPTVGMVGLIEDINKATKQWFKEEGDIIVLLGDTKEDIGGSEYLKVVHGLDKGLPPIIDLNIEKNTHNACLNLINAGIIESAHDLSEGGLLIAIIEKALNNNYSCNNKDEDLLGADIEIDFKNIRPDFYLLSESQSRILLTLKEKDLDALKAICEKENVPFEKIGTVIKNKFKINDLIEIDTKELKEVWQGSIKKFIEKVN